MRLALVALLWMTGAAMAERPVTVFAAASLADVLAEIALGWEAGDVVISAAGSSALARQIQQGAPADIFVSANVAWMDALERDGVIAPQTRVVLARNALVLVAHDAVEPFELTQLPDMVGQERLAVALVDAVPAGIYAKQALTGLGLWSRLGPRLAQTDNVRAALALVARGETPFGIVYATDAVAAPEVRVVARFAQNAHDPILYPAALVTPVSQKAAAFLGYLGSTDAGEVFAAHGFGAP